MCMIRPMYDVYDMYDNIRMISFPNLGGFSNKSLFFLVGQ